MRESFIFYRSFYEAIKGLPRDVQGEIYTAIMEYGLYGNEIEHLKPIARSVFTLVKPQIDKNNKRFDNGLKGGRPQGSGERTKPNNNQTETKPEPNNNQDETKHEPNDNVNDNVNDKGGIDIPPCGGDPHEPPPPDYQAIVDFFNRETQGVFGNIRYPLSEQRRRMVAARIKERGAETFADMVRRAARSDFLRGQNARGWTATFDWLIKPSNFEKVISGNYDNKDPKATPSGTDTRPTDNFLRGVADGIARADYDIQRRGASR